VRTAAQRGAILCASLLLFANTSCAASFDCAKAGTKVEKMICADPELSKLDEDLSAAYGKALKESSDLSALRQQQRNWLAERNGCLDSDCLESSYRSQIGELTGEPKSRKLLTLLAKNEKLCGDYKNYIEHEVATKQQYGHMTVPMCQRPFGEGYPEFKAVQWREVSPEDHPNLAVQAYRYINFWPWKRPGAASFLKENLYQIQLDGIKLNYSNGWWHMWLGKADIGNRGHMETLLKVEDGRCGDVSATGRPEMWSVSLMVVDASGKGIDTVKSEWILGVTVLPPNPINMTKGIHGLGRSTLDAFRYAGKEYYDRWEDQWTFSNEKPYDPRYSRLTVYKIEGDKSEATCCFKFNKNSNDLGVNP